MKSRKSKKDKQYSGQTIEDTNGGIIRHRSKDRKCNDKERKKDKRTNNDVQNTTQKTKDWTTQTPHKPGVNSGAIYLVLQLYIGFRTLIMLFISFFILVGNLFWTT